MALNVSQAPDYQCQSRWAINHILRPLKKKASWQATTSLPHGRNLFQTSVGIYHADGPDLGVRSI